MSKILSALGGRAGQSSLVASALLASVLIGGGTSSASEPRPDFCNLGATGHGSTSFYSFTADFTDSGAGLCGGYQGRAYVVCNNGVTVPGGILTSNGSSVAECSGMQGNTSQWGYQLRLGNNGSWDTHRLTS